MPNAQINPCEFVGHCNRGNFVVPFGRHCDGPLLKWSQTLRRRAMVGSEAGAVLHRSGLSVAPRFLWECLTSQTVSPAVPTDILHFPARVVVTPTDGPYVLEGLSGVKERPASGT